MVNNNFPYAVVVSSQDSFILFKCAPFWAMNSVIQTDTSWSELNELNPLQQQRLLTEPV